MGRKTGPGLVMEIEVFLLCQLFNPSGECMKFIDIYYVDVSISAWVSHAMPLKTAQKLDKVKNCNGKWKSLINRQFRMKSRVILHNSTGLHNTRNQYLNMIP